MEIKRYSLVEYIGYKTKTIDSIEEYNNLIKEFKKNNSSDKTKVFYGNLTYREEKGKYLVFYDEYRRITFPARLEALYYVTTCFANMKQLKDYCKAKTNNIYISYFNTKSPKEQRYKTKDICIRKLPVLFNNDKHYLNETYLCNIISLMASQKEYSFFDRMCDRFKNLPDVKGEINRVYEAIDEVQRDFNPINLEIRGIQLFKKIIRYRDKDGKLVKNDDGTYKNVYKKFVDVALFIKEICEEDSIEDNFSLNRSL